MDIGFGSLGHLARLRSGVRRERASSWDRTGGNADYLAIPSGAAHTLAALEGAGCIRHLWMTMSSDDPLYARKVALRMWWDGEPWPPRLHGTGTEDYFNAPFCPAEEFCAPYHGLTVYSGTPDWEWSGKNSLYRYHIEDPVYFERSIRVSIEHGHANNLANDYSSTAYWYQAEPHKPFPPLPPAAERLPR